MKLHKKLTWAFALLLTAGLGACSQADGEPELPGGGDDCMLRLDIGMNDDTRGIMTRFSKGDEIFVGLFDQSKTGAEAFITGEKATYNGSEWVLANPVNLAKIERLNNGGAAMQMIVEAVYPYSIVGNRNLAELLTPQGYLVIDNALAQEDILYGAATGIGKLNPTASIKFDHAMARLTIQAYSQSEGTVTLENVTLGNDVKAFEEANGGWLYNKCVLTPAGIDTAQSRENGVGNKVTLPGTMTIQPDGMQSFDVLIPPTAAQAKKAAEAQNVGGLKLTVTANGKAVNANIPATDWKPGRKYVYPLVLPAGL